MLNVVAKTHYTKEQLERSILADLDGAQAPKKGRALFVAVPIAQGPSMRITWTAHKSTDGKSRLYLVEYLA
ncbi:MAG: hypothetical protein ACK515_02540 [bacterium]